MKYASTDIKQRIMEIIKEMGFRHLHANIIKYSVWGDDIVEYVIFQINGHQYKIQYSGSKENNVYYKTIYQFNALEE